MSNSMFALNLRGAEGKQGRMVPACPAYLTAGIGRFVAQRHFVNTYKSRTSRSLRPCIRAEIITANRGSSVMQSGNWDEKGCEDVVLIADIGGTNCRFQLWRIDTRSAKAVEMLLQVMYQTKQYSTFQEALSALQEEPVFKANVPKSAAFAVAGPVIKNKCEMTNLSWTIDGHYLTKKYGVSMGVLNDFEANGYGILALQPEDVVVLNDVPAAKQGPKVILGPGTGLGQAQLFWDDYQENYKVFPSEGAHGAFAPRGWKQRALQEWVETKLGYCEIEHVSCGSGLARIYQFLQSDQPSNRPCTDLTMEMDPPAITKAALAGTDPVALEAVDLFLAIIGAEAGYMGMRALATGGIYICGGITPRLIDRINRKGLLDSFLWKESRFNKMLRNFPLYAVINDGLGLLGAREYATRLLLAPELCKTL